MSTSIAGAMPARRSIEQLIGDLRPKLHRYCARMTGSVIDGEDVVQESLAKAIDARPEDAEVRDPESWLFRIAHNASLDFLRRRRRLDALRSDADPDLLIDPVAVADDRQTTAASLRTLMRLPVAQRSSVVLMDVLGYSLHEISGITSASIPTIKAALHRGRARLRELAKEPDDAPLPLLPDAERSRLAEYVDRFNARDFDRVRDMLADDVRLELVNRTELNGRGAVAKYFTNYAAVADWRLALGRVDGRAALIVLDPGEPAAAPRYFILLKWDGDRLTGIRDFRHAGYVMDGAALTVTD